MTRRLNSLDDIAIFQMPRPTRRRGDDYDDYTAAPKRSRMSPEYSNRAYQDVDDGYYRADNNYPTRYVYFKIMLLLLS